MTQILFGLIVQLGRETGMWIDRVLPLPRLRRAARHWRRTRPFWAGALVIAAGVEIILIPLAPLPIMIRVGMGAVSGMAIGLILIVAGLFFWFAPRQRTFVAIVTAICAMTSFVTTNLGGFGIGMGMGLLGASMAFGWSPHRRSGSAPVRRAETAEEAEHAPAGPGPAPARSGRRRPRPGDAEGDAGAAVGGLVVPLLLAGSLLVPAQETDEWGEPADCLPLSVLPVPSASPSASPSVSPQADGVVVDRPGWPDWTWPWERGESGASPAPEPSGLSSPSPSLPVDCLPPAPSPSPSPSPSAPPGQEGEGDGEESEEDAPAAVPCGTGVPPEGGAAEGEPLSEDASDRVPPSPEEVLQDLREEAAAGADPLVTPAADGPDPGCAPPRADDVPEGYAVGASSALVSADSLVSEGITVKGTTELRTADGPMEVLVVHSDRIIAENYRFTTTDEVGARMEMVVDLDIRDVHIYAEELTATAEVPYLGVPLVRLTVTPKLIPSWLEIGVPIEISARDVVADQSLVDAGSVGISSLTAEVV